MIIGMDTDQPLNSRHFTAPRTDGRRGTRWDAFQEWLGGSPAFAGRYFNSNASGAFRQGEAKAARQMSGGRLSRIVPIQGAPFRQYRKSTQELGVDIRQGQFQRGFDVGAREALRTCDGIWAAWDSEPLKLPESSEVLVYLDVEGGTRLSPHYWAGWASTVYNYSFFHQAAALPSVPLLSAAPLLPAMYCRFERGADGLYHPEHFIQDCLDRAPALWPRHHTFCYGFWSSHPEPCRLCAAPFAFRPDESSFGLFGVYRQPRSGGQRAQVPVTLWQFAESEGCQNLGRDPRGCRQPAENAFASRLNLDMDAANDRPGVNATEYMFLIP